MILREKVNFQMVSESFATALRICFCVATLWMAAPVHAQDIVTKPVNRAERTMLHGHHPAWANGANDVGTVPGDTQLTSLTLVLARPAEREKAFEQVMKDQQDSSSPNYHHWLTPVEIGAQFGVSSHDIEAIRAWLESEGLHLDSTASSMTRIRFSGTAAEVAGAFGAEMRYYEVNNEKRISISDEPQIPAALVSVIQSVTGLHNVKLRPMHRVTTGEVIQNEVAPRMLRTAAKSAQSNSPDGTFTCGGSPCSFITPGDFATIYNVNPVYANGVHGEGQTIAIIGQSAVNPADITSFQTRTGLAQVAPTVIVPPNGIAPAAPATASGTTPSGDQLEATLDVTRAGSVASAAVIDLIVSGDTKTANGLDLAAEYAVDTTPVPGNVMSISFGACEAQNVSGVQFWNSLFQQAAAEGISVFVSSGDAGAAECDDQFSAAPTTQIASPNYICSSSFATCVGGTEFADSNRSLYWGTTNGTGLSSALSYIPEGAWNEPTDDAGKVQVAASGGGVSTVIPTPSYQTGVGVPSPTVGRYTPDVSFSSALHDGYFACVAASGASCIGTSSFQFSDFGGTSAAAPDMAGIAALLNQSMGSAQGNLNPRLYQLAANPALNVFNDVTAATSGVSGCDVGTPSMCNNSTPGPTSLTGGLNGFSVGTGFDEATGLGSINVANLLANWKQSSGTNPNPVPAITSISPTNGFAGVAIPVLTITGTNFVSGASVTFNGTSNPGTISNNGTSITASISGSELSSGGTASVTVVNPGPGGGPSNVANFVISDFSVTGSTQAQTIAAGANASFAVNVSTQVGALPSSVTFSASNLPPNATATFTPASIAAGATSGATTLKISTTAHGEIPPSFSPRDPARPYLPIVLTVFAISVLWMERKRIFARNSEQLCFAGTNSRRRFSATAMIVPSLLMLCAVFGAGCGSSVGTTTVPGGGSTTGTAAGTYTITVTATDGTVSHNTTVTLVVQ